MKEGKKLKAKDIDALIFDLDGVITQTRDTHKKAWKQLFDSFLEERGMNDRLGEGDYEEYLDGKPRYEGVKSFLLSRNISLPYGSENDPSEKETVCGLGNRKNEFFNRLISKEGAEVYDEAVASLRKWRRMGIKTAIVSSSKNCKAIIEKAGIDHLFDVRVDGLVAAERGLSGKPDPTIFLEAARELDVRPERSIVFEDAISGVQAGQRGFFGLVVGVARFDNRDELLRHGADMCIDSFDQFDLFGDEHIAGYFRYTKPMVFSAGSDVFDILKQKRPVFFLDYDGTLTPIVNRPEDAQISATMRSTLSELAGRFTVAVVTGRDKEDVEDFIGLDQLIYSGSHGFVTSGPGGMYMEHEQSEEIIRQLDQAEKDLHRLLDNKGEGVQIERKKYAIAVHYRNAPEKYVPQVMESVDQLVGKGESLKKGEGKKVVEVKPDIDWHKGKAVWWIMEALGLDKQKDTVPVFIGDDVTDEDAFKVLKGKGIGILVENRGQETCADYSLKNVFQVEQFFKKVIELYAG